MCIRNAFTFVVVATSAAGLPTSTSTQDVVGSIPRAQLFKQGIGTDSVLAAIETTLFERVSILAMGTIVGDGFPVDAPHSVRELGLIERYSYVFHAESLGATCQAGKTNIGLAPHNIGPASRMHCKRLL